MTYTYTYTAAELQQHHDTVADGEKNGFAIAPNLIKTSRLVVQGVDGEPLPTNGTNTNYTAGVEVAFGCVAGTNIVNLTNDTAGDGGNWTATSGTIYFEVDIGPGRTIANYFGSVMQADGTQLYADDTPGITLTENSGKARLTVDFAQVSFSVWGISEQRGKLEYLSDQGVVNTLQPDLIAARAWQDVTASRSASVTYTNDSDVEISFSVKTTQGDSSTHSVRLFVDGIEIARSQSDSASSIESMWASVPVGSTYRADLVSVGASITIASWDELRV